MPGLLSERSRQSEHLHAAIVEQAVDGGILPGSATDLHQTPVTGF